MKSLLHHAVCLRSGVLLPRILLPSRGAQIMPHETHVSPLCILLVVTQMHNLFLDRPLMLRGRGGVKQTAHVKRF